MSEDDEEERADPFENLESAVGEREGNPFEELTSQDRSDDKVSSPDSSEEDGSDSTTEEAHPSEEEKPVTDPISAESEPGGREQRETGEQDETFSESGFEALEPKSNAESTRTESDSETPQSEPQFEQGEENEPSWLDADSTGDENERKRRDFGIERGETDSPTEMPSLSDTDTRQGDPFQGLEDAFSEVDVEGLDPDAVWEELTSAQSRGSISDSGKRTYAEVSKHAYCEGCEHFSKPPDVHCTNEGTEIVEFLDTETVRVVDCPVVTERAQLESGGHGKD